MMMKTITSRKQNSRRAEIEGYAVAGFDGREDVAKPSIALAWFGCAAAVALALVGAALAFQPEPTLTLVRGDRIGAPVTRPAATVEDVNVDGAVSNLLRFDGEPVTL